MTTLQLRKSIGRSPLRLSLILITIALGCFALAPTSRAVTPLPDGGYPGFNTAEGDYETLYNNTTGKNNTAIGCVALYYNTTENDNTATGAFALQANNGGSRNTATGSYALGSFITGSDNTAGGYQALFKVIIYLTKSEGETNAGT